MGRELRRKQAKKEGKSVREAQKMAKDKPLSMKAFITIVISLILCFVLLYILTGIFVTKDIKWFDKKDNTTTNDGNSISNKILGVDALRQSESEYYVYFYDPSNEESLVSSKVNSLSVVYRVDLSDSFNSNFIGDNSGIVSDINDLKVSNPTIIKVVNGDITNIYSGANEINSIS